MTRTLPFIAAAALACAACVSGPGEMAAPPAPDWDMWVDEVQPVLAEHCANPSCHGNVDRPLEVFAVHRHRLDPADTYLDAPLTTEELTVGYEKARAMIVPGEYADDCLLLRKPEPTHLGGAPHQGGVQFEAPEYDPDYQALRVWIELVAEEAPSP